MNYPVIAEHILATVQGTWWARRRRREDVPPLPPGAVHVFRVGGNYRTFPEGMVFDPSTPMCSTPRRSAWSTPGRAWWTWTVPCRR